MQSVADNGAAVVDRGRARGAGLRDPDAEIARAAAGAADAAVIGDGDVVAAGRAGEHAGGARDYAVVGDRQLAAGGIGIDADGAAADLARLRRGDRQRARTGIVGVDANADAVRDL